MSIEHAAWLVERAMTDGAFTEQLTRAPERAKEKLVSEFPELRDAEEAELNRTVGQAISAFGVLTKLRTNAREEEHHQIRMMSNEFRKGLVNVIHEIEAGYGRVMLMYTVAFYTGIFLIGLSVIASLWLNNDVAAMIFGGLGLADVVTSFIFRPAQELQNSRGNLTQLQAAFFSWINDVRNWNAYLERLDGSVRRGDRPPYDEFERVSQRVLANTGEMMRLVDLYCEMHASAVTKKAGTGAAADKQGC